MPFSPSAEAFSDCGQVPKVVLHHLLELPALHVARAEGMGLVFRQLLLLDVGVARQLLLIPDQSLPVGVSPIHRAAEGGAVEHVAEYGMGDDVAALGFALETPLGSAGDPDGGDLLILVEPSSTDEHQNQGRRRTSRGGRGAILRAFRSRAMLDTIRGETRLSQVRLPEPLSGLAYHLDLSESPFSDPPP